MLLQFLEYGLASHPKSLKRADDPSTEGLHMNGFPSVSRIQFLGLVSILSNK